jgi:hypothetical protein
VYFQLSLLGADRDLVLFGKHDGENPPGLLGVGRVFGPEHHVAVVVVDLPKELFTGNFKAGEVMLVMRIVVRVEARETLDMQRSPANRDSRTTSIPTS